MGDNRDELAELEEEIRRIIKENERFLSRILDEDFSDDEETGDDPEPWEEL